MEYANAEDEVESSFPKREVEYVRLRNADVLPRADIPLCSIDRTAEIDRHDRGAPSGGYVRESTHSTADIENALATQLFGRETGLDLERPLRLVAGSGVQLSSGVERPLEAEVLHIQLAFYESWDAANDRELMPLLAPERARLDLICPLSAAR